MGKKDGKANGKVQQQGSKHPSVTRGADAKFLYALSQEYRAEAINIETDEPEKAKAWRERASILAGLSNRAYGGGLKWHIVEQARQQYLADLPHRNASYQEAKLTERQRRVYVVLKSKFEAGVTTTKMGAPAFTPQNSDMAPLQAEGIDPELLKQFIAFQESLKVTKPVVEVVEE